MDLNTTPIKIDIEPGETTSENAIAKFAQAGGGGLIAAVLTIAVMQPDLPPSIIITALIVACIITIAPTLHYIASRRALKCEQCRAEADVQKQQIAKQATVAKEANRST